ncbi:Transcription initiation factor TFIID subunit 13 [Saguinus oedipus]|uniref:Transcription initiation factor TFIID subunit 13 n=1 Tax=Saguinus oedipus TaxID=9490 RepID=A0ABQ9V576_SAGOE|nr:Transcription initiation factor TFIID subunit 13 [Saguinus oedipus]
MADEEEDPTFEEENEEIRGGAEGGQVDILEDLVIQLITEVTHKAMFIGRQGRVKVEDIVFLIRQDPRKFARVKDLLTIN